MKKVAIYVRVSTQEQAVEDIPFRSRSTGLQNSAKLIPGRSIKYIRIRAFLAEI